MKVVCLGYLDPEKWEAYSEAKRDHRYLGEVPSLLPGDVSLGAPRSGGAGGGKLRLRIRTASSSSR